MRYIVAVAVVAMLLSIPGINIYHHIEMPTINKHKIVSQYVFDRKATMLFHKQIDVRLATDIMRPEFYEDVLEVLTNATSSDVIIFHLVGYGGEVETALNLINNIKATKAHTIMSVEAPIYSAHAYIAVSGNELKMSPYSSLMFHESSLANVDCSQQKGVDRGVSNVVHCEAYVENSKDLEYKLIREMFVLTTKEKVLILLGYDVYITADDYYKRVGVVGQGHATN